jgi:hypothetical protein
VVEWGECVYICGYLGARLLYVVGEGLWGKVEIKRISVKLLDMGGDKMGMFAPFCGFPPFPIGTRPC